LSRFKVLKENFLKFKLWYSFSLLFGYNNMQMVKLSQLKKKHEDSQGAKESHFYLRKNTGKSLTLAFCLPQLTKFIDPDPHRDFCLNPDPQ
jgi:hypothetical protein